MYSLYTLFNRNYISYIMSYSFLILYVIYYYGLYFFNDHYKNQSFLLFPKIYTFKSIYYTYLSGRRCVCMQQMIILFQKYLMTT